MESAPLSMVYRSEKQLPKLNLAFQEFYEHEEFCDITLVATTKRFRAHRVILAAFSPYFYQAFSQQNSYLSEFSCHRFDEGSLKCLLDFCYSGVITVNSVSAEKLLSVATVLQIKEVEKLCQTFLRAHQAFVHEVQLIFCIWPEKFPNIFYETDKFLKCDFVLMVWYFLNF